MTCICCDKPLDDTSLACGNQECLLHDMEQTPDDIPKLHDYRRQKIVEQAIRTADRIIMDGSDGSDEETDFLTSCVAMAFMEKLHWGICSRRYFQDIMRRSDELSTK